VDDIPFARREAQRLAQRRNRVLVLVGVDGGNRSARPGRVGRTGRRVLIELGPVVGRPGVSSYSGTL